MGDRKSGRFRSAADLQEAQAAQREAEFRHRYRDWWGYLLFKVVFWAVEAPLIIVIITFLHPRTAKYGLLVDVVSMVAAVTITIALWAPGAAWIARRIRG